MAEFAFILKKTVPDSNNFKNCPVCDDHEVLWVQLRPNRLPSGFSSLIVAVVYHPHWAETENSSMRERLFRSLSLLLSRNFPTVHLLLRVTLIASTLNR